MRPLVSIVDNSFDRHVAFLLAEFTFTFALIDNAGRNVEKTAFHYESSPRELVVMVSLLRLFWVHLCRNGHNGASSP